MFFKSNVIDTVVEEENPVTDTEFDPYFFLPQAHKELSPPKKGTSLRERGDFEAPTLTYWSMTSRSADDHGRHSRRRCCRWLRPVCPLLWQHACDGGGVPPAVRPRSSGAGRSRTATDARVPTRGESSRGHRPEPATRGLKEEAKRENVTTVWQPVCFSNSQNNVTSSRNGSTKRAVENVACSSFDDCQLEHTRPGCNTLKTQTSVSTRIVRQRSGQDG